MEYFNELLAIVNAMSPYLLLGFFVAGLLHVYTPKATFTKYLSKKGFKSVFLSTLFGVPLPLCSCGVIPTAMSLKKEGASDGATVAFLIATPQTGVDSILATYGLLGLPFAIIRPIVAFVVAIVGGLLVDGVTGDDLGEGKSAQGSASQNVSSKKLGFVDVFKYGFVDMLQDLGKWLSIGLLIAAAVTVFVPNSLFELFNEYYLLNILVVLLLSVPMYVCSTGSIPIALSLLLVGVSPGAALVFLMAGPATNVATLAVVKKVLGLKITLIYLATIILGAIVFALFIDLVLPVEWFTYKLAALSGDAHNCGAAWWQVGSSILFVVLLVNAYVLKLIYGSSHTHSYEIEDEVEVDANKVQKFKVEGMRCNHCRANVEKAIATLEGVTFVSVDLASGDVEVHGNVSRDDVCSAVSELGFDIS
ncbi:MAG: permease [Rikenellaceae bacterium]